MDCYGLGRFDHAAVPYSLSESSQATVPSSWPPIVTRVRVRVRVTVLLKK